MKLIRLLAEVSIWISAAILAALPIIVAIDFGGVLWWTQYVAAIAILAAAFFALPTLVGRESTGLLRQHYLTLVLLVWCAYAWLQTVPMFVGLVGTLSNGSKLAYRDWIEPYVGSDGLGLFCPLSIAPEQSAHAAALLTLVLCLVWTSTQVFVSRAKIGMLLNVLAIGAALHAAFGILRQVYPEIQVLGVDMKPHSFGCFVNRNNAALLMNLGLGASLGLLAWRLSAHTGLEVDENNFEFNDLMSLTGDRDSLIGLISASLCITGLLINGSRGGLVAMIIGLLLAFGWIRQKRGSRTIPVVIATVLLCVAILVIPLNLQLESVQRFEIMDNESNTTLLTDGRMQHWRTTLQTARAYFPAGSGLGSYGYAYLPYQVDGMPQWFEHADNLWLEMLVEQGLVGLLLTACVLFLWIRTLLRMSESVDPIDHGLRIAGWFVVGSICAAQLFDFGLVIPSLLFATAIYLSANIARATAAGLNVGKQEKEIFPKKYSKYVAGGLTGLVLLFAVLGTLRLAVDAEIESVVKYVEARMPTSGQDSDKLSKLAQRLQNAPRSQESPMLLDLLCKVQHAQARLIETSAANPASATEANSVYGKTEIMVRRKAWNEHRIRLAATLAEDSSEGSDVDLDNDPIIDPSVESNQDSSDNPEAQVDTGDRLHLLFNDSPATELYEDVLNNSLASLRRLPLGIESRTWQLYFDFVHQDSNRSDQAISQLVQMYTGNPEMLMRLGRHAIAAGDEQLAKKLWRRSLVRDSRLALPVLQLVQDQGQIDIQTVLPSDPVVFRRVTRHLLDQGRATEPLLKQARKEIACDSCTSNKSKSACHRLGHDIAYKLGEYDDAFDQLRMAIELTPTDKRLHLLYVSRLRESGRTTNARIAAQRARILFPDEARFDRFIREIAAQELEGLGEISDPLQQNLE